MIGLEPQWRRIHVIGGAGSGKTTLARQFAERLAIPVYDLDAVAYLGGAGAKRPLAARQADAHRIAMQSEWITEGAFLWWIDELVEAADVIVWIDLPWRIAAWRVVKRHIRASMAGTNKHRGIRKLLRFVRWTRRYYRSTSAPAAPDEDGATSRTATAAMLQPYMSKVVHCRRPSAVKKLLKATM